MPLCPLADCHVLPGGQEIHPQTLQSKFSLSPSVRPTGSQLSSTTFWEQMSDTAHVNQEVSRKAIFPGLPAPHQPHQQVSFDGAALGSVKRQPERPALSKVLCGGGDGGPSSFWVPISNSHSQDTHFPPLLFSYLLTFFCHANPSGFFCFNFPVSNHSSSPEQQASGPQPQGTPGEG